MRTHYVAAWKSGTAAVWRGLTWSEYRSFTRRLTIESPLDVYIDIYRAILLEGPDITAAPAGVVEYIARTMLETNPFNGQVPYVRHALAVRRGAQTFLDDAKALVAGIFRYTFEEIDSWDCDTFFDRVSKAEFLTGKQLEVIDPAAEAAAAEAAKKPGAPKPQRPKKPLTPGQQLSLDRVNGRT